MRAQDRPARRRAGAALHAEPRRLGRLDGPGGPRPDIGVLRSDDHGRSWRSIAKGLPSDFGFPIVVHPHDADTIYVVPLETSTRACPGGAPAVWRSENGGGSWSKLAKGFPKKESYFTVLRDAMDIDQLKTPALYFGTTTGPVVDGPRGRRGVGVRLRRAAADSQREGRGRLRHLVRRRRPHAGEANHQGIAQGQTRGQVAVHASRAVRARGDRARPRRQARRPIGEQAIAIGLAKARRAGVKLPPPPASASERTKRSAKSASKRRHTKPSPARSQAARAELQDEPTNTASSAALSRQAKAAARRRSGASRRPRRGKLRGRGRVAPSDARPPA